MKVILFDAMNLIHRSRNSFSRGDHALTYSFFRSFKPLAEKFNADLAYFVLEGRPAHRSEEYEGYKSNRPAQPSSFWRQCGEILETMRSLPIIQIKHPDYECDDVIANLAKHHCDIGNEVIIVSCDSDFIQVFDNMNPDLVSIYHPIKKSFVENPEYTYLEWKALRGDVSDNIPGIKGVGDKTATKIINDPALFEKTMADPEKKMIFERNKSLIQFHWFDDLSDDLKNAGSEVVYPDICFDTVRETFDKMEFGTMLTDRYWPKFMASFETLATGYRR